MEENPKASLGFSFDKNRAQAITRLQAISARRRPCQLPRAFEMWIDMQPQNQQLAKVLASPALHGRSSAMCYSCDVPAARTETCLSAGSRFASRPPSHVVLGTRRSDGSRKNKRTSSGHRLPDRRSPIEGSSDGKKGMEAPSERMQGVSSCQADLFREINTLMHPRRVT